MRSLVASIIVLGAVGQAAAATPCDQLAARARDLPPSAWTKGEAALRPALQLEKSKTPTPAMTKLLQDRRLQDALDAGSYAVFVEHMPGSDLIMAETIQGAAECQNAVFFRRRAGRIVRVPYPVKVGEGELCWTHVGDFARVFGRPAFVVHGSVTDHTLDEKIEVVPWTGTRWGAACTLGLTFRTSYAVAQRFCGDREVCRQAEAVAVDMAKAYAAQRNGSEDAAGFRYGPAPSPAAEAAVAADRAGAESTDTLTFPTFGEKADVYETTFSYPGFVTFPLKLGEASYVAAVGLAGVGWRQSDRTLIAVYKAAPGDPKPLAGIAVDASNAGLERATVGRPASRVKQR